jgi:transcriptional regulator with XRE-family HTH domain
MSTTSIAATREFVPGSSRIPKRLDTLRAQMASEIADLERGERIRELREARRLTQQAVWERMCVEGGSKPDGRPFISLRMYQRYEEGRGISWEKLRVLAEVLDAGEDYILRGEGERRQPRPARSVDNDLAERLASIEDRLERVSDLPQLAERLDRIEAAIGEATRQAGSERQQIAAQLAQENELLARQANILQRIEDALKQDQELATVLADEGDEFARRLLQLARRELRADAEAQEQSKRTREQSGTRRG